jgi:type I restriction enzyme S subunit
VSTVQFGELFALIRNGLNVKQDKSQGGLPITRIETISGGYLDGKRVGYADLRESDYAEWLLRPGDILFSHINSVDHIGKCAIYRGQPDKLVHGMNLLCLRCNVNRLYPEFAKYLIRSGEFRARLSHFINKAVNQASVSIGNLKTINVNIPSLPEQRRIAEVLDRAEALRTKRRAALAELDALPGSIFIDLFGNTDTNAKGWKVNPFRQLVQEFRYGTSIKSAATGKPALRIPNVIGGIIDISDLKFVPVDAAEFERLKLIEGDVLFVRTNGNPDFVGRCAVFDETAVTKPGLTNGEFVFASYLIRARLRLNLISPIFLREFMRGSAGRRELRSRCTTSAGQYNINTENLGAIAVPLPPLALQHEFERRVSMVEKLKRLHRTSFLELDALFAALQQSAFRGDLRIVDLHPHDA